jgi:hypothetical protein
MQTEVMDKVLEIKASKKEKLGYLLNELLISLQIYKYNEIP